MLESVQDLVRLQIIGPGLSLPTEENEPELAEITPTVSETENEKQDIKKGKRLIQNT